MGERQLLSFARALALDPRILVLDEATSSVDAEAEAQIQRAIAELMAGRTSLVVAHRLSTILHADEILVLHHGEIRERGSHRELLAQRGLYERLYQLQLRGQERAQNCLTRVCLRGYGPGDTFVGDRLSPQDSIDDAPRNRRRAHSRCPPVRRS